MKQILKDYNIMHVAFSLAAFICMSPYLIWGFALYYRASAIITFFIFVCFVVNKRYAFNTKYLIYTLIFAFFLIYLCLPGQEGVPGFNYTFALIIIFLILKDIDKKKIYNIFSWIFVLSLVPSIIIFICILLGIDLDWTRMDPIYTGKLATGFYYKQYFGAIFLGKDYSTIFRMCGMYDEPGVVGTISALLLVGDNFNLKRNLKNILLLIAGILSLSLAFIVIIVLYILLKKRFYKKAFIFLIIMFIALNNISTENELIKRYIIDRLAIEDNWIVGSKRTTSSFDYGFQKFIQEGSVTHLIFGMGNNAHIENRMLGGSSYKNIIYNYGFFGFGFLIIWLILFSLSIIKSKEGIILLILFILSIYQRPLIFTLYYMIILFGGLANLRFFAENQMQSLSKH